MELKANGESLMLIAGAGGVKKGTPFLHGELLVIPASDAKEGRPYTGLISGAFVNYEEHLVADMTVADKDTAYFTPEGKLSKNKTGNLKIGHFVENHQMPMLLVK